MLSTNNERKTDPRQATNDREYPKRFTVRVRLALSYAAVVMLSGLMLTACITVYFGLIPTYGFAGQFESTPGTSDDVVIQLSESELSLLLPADLGITIDSRGDMLGQLLVVSGSVLLVMALLGAWVGWQIAGRMLRPLQDVNRAARRASQGHLEHRIALKGPRDEITELADTFDEMLDEIEQSVESHRRFAANASHELRTPLATNKVMLDVALADEEREGSVDRELLNRLREINERSISTVESLLDLAEIQAGSGTREAVDLLPIITTVVQNTADESRKAGVVVAVERETAAAVCDPVLVRQLLSNLVLNAIRHNHTGGRVDIGVIRQAGYAGVQISNTGTPITHQQAAQLTEPFYRREGRVSTGTASGRGLGLSIVKAIVTAHKGTLNIRANAAGGISVTVLLPQAERSRAENV